MNTTATLFFPQILDLLNKHCTYVILGRRVARAGSEEAGILHIELLMEKRFLGLISEYLSKMEAVESVRSNSRYEVCRLLVELKEGASIQLTIIHKFVFHGLHYFDEKALLASRIEAFDGAQVPCIEHQFEYAVLQNFLEHRGVQDWQYRYFKSFHILLIEDLLDAFNAKYHTLFSDLSDLINCSEANRKQILKYIRKLSGNDFLHSIHLHWHNFLGAVRLG